MHKKRTISAMLAFGLLFGSPLAWGCEWASMQDCSLSACPMTDHHAAKGCHEAAVTPAEISSACDAQPQASIECCASPAEPEPARMDSQSIWDDNVSPLTVLADAVQQPPPSRPPDLVSNAISSQQHELGRFTLLSSFLL